MRVARPILVAVSASAMAALVPLSGVASAVEEPPHRVAARDRDFEIRDYPVLSVAEVIVQGDRNSVAYAGFRKLAGFIFGANARKQSIEMTAPVIEVIHCVCFNVKACDARQTERVGGAGVPNAPKRRSKLAIARAHAERRWSGSRLI